MATKYRGVYIKDGICWISYNTPDGRIRKSTGLPDTAKNRKTAADIVAAARISTQPAARREVSFADFSSQWLDSQDHLATATWDSYRKILNAYWLPGLASLPIHSITGTDLAGIVAEFPWQSAKTRNNAISVIRRIFDAAFRDGLIDSDPSVRLRFAKAQKPEPDPMSPDEVERVLAWMAPRPVWRNYFELAFFTGLRTSELLALEWGDIDWRRRTMTVRRARVRRETKSTKTATIRTVELTTRAVEALRRQKEYTFLAGSLVFLDPATGRQINDDKPPRLVWTAALKALGIRHRNAYQTRHTYATTALMSGANPAWIARQLGHANMGMLLTRYSRWMDGYDQGSELEKLEKRISRED